MFVFVGAIMLGIYFYNSKNNTTTNTGNTSIIQKFNPFGTSTKIPTENNGDNVQDNNNQDGNQAIINSRFHKITDFAVAGAVFFEDTRALPAKENITEVVTTVETVAPTKKVIKNAIIPKPEPTTEVVPSIRYVEKATGHVYQMYLDTNVEGKISNSTIPGVYETIFSGDGSSIIYRYPSSDNKSITSFLATLRGGKSSFLSSDIMDISLSPDKTKFFSIIKNSNGVVGTIKYFDSTKTNQIFTSAFSEWLPQWVTEQKIYLTTKPSYRVEGSVFNLNTTNGTLSKIFGGIKGLTTLANNNGEVVLYGASLEEGPKLNVFNIKDHTSTDLDKYGLPEKCVWSSDNINVYCAIPNTVIGTQYPDSWYQGLVSFDDRFVKINTNTKESSTLANSGDETPVDGTKLFLNKDESKLFFINKKDSTLWSLELK